MLTRIKLPARQRVSFSCEAPWDHLPAIKYRIREEKDCLIYYKSIHLIMWQIIA